MPGGTEFCVLSATGIADPSGQIFANGTWKLEFKSTPNTPGVFIDIGSSGPGFTKIFGGNLDGSGAFTIAGGLVRNDSIAPAGSRWTLTVIPNANGQAYSVDLNLLLSSVDCTTQINAVITNVLVQATSISHAYKDSEIILTPNSGGIYFDVVNKVIKVWDIANQVWINPSSGLTPTGSGFVHITAGVQDGAARNPVLASSDFANQGTVATVLHGNAAGNPSFAKVTSADVDNTVALTGVDINTAAQVISTHLAAALPVLQGGTGVTTSTGTGNTVRSNTPTFTTPNIDVATATAIISATANAAAAGFIKLASSDLINFRNNANSADLSIAKTGATVGLVIADTLNLASFAGLFLASPIWGANSIAVDVTHPISIPAVTDTMALLAAPQTFTTKRITPRNTAVADATSITPNSDTTDIVTQVNTQAGGTLTLNAPTGTPTDGQKLIIRIKSTNAQTYSFNATYAFSTSVTAPVTLAAGKTDYIGLMWNAANTKWDVVSVDQGH